eukprot:GFUD01136875.1.p1 GENE.GFUD01136875.1~~GFUD01136875.1.p1  ORF type:complete len:141 (-),score=34.57 GFUD01136875.1:140-562(-)
MFLMITTISIKVFFGMKTNQQGKPRIKNSIGFQKLNIIYSLGLAFSAVLSGVMMMIQSKDVYTGHYHVTMVFNMMLLSFILGDHKAREFFRLKFQSWKEENMFNLQKLNVCKAKYKIGPMVGVDLETGNGVKGVVKNDCE